MTRHYSALSLFKEGLAGQKGWQQAWRSPQPKPRYDILVIGGGGHGLATAYYLASVHNIRNVAVIEKGWLGGGNTGRNTTVVRSNYFFPESTALYEMALKLYEELGRELNYNIMLSQRGIITLAHSEAEMEMAARTVNAMQINGTDAELFGIEDVRRVLPLLNMSPDARHPVFGGVWQGRAGTARHDAVAWGYARAADRLGVDIIQSCEVEEFLIEGGRCRGVRTSRGEIRADRVGMVVAGHSSHLAAKAGFHLPITSYANVLRGVVKLTKVLEDGRQQVVGLQFAPDLLGRPMASESRVTAETASDVELCMFPKPALEALMRDGGPVEHRIMMQALRELDEARDWMVTLGRK
ncbi:MAG: FAD-dependent oxidoreductase, partial [Rhizobiales bacterium]|nr:FAD-dependent oxidoreductase [Hyphomicrobiales bacterium]